ncbi:hypothetical protein, partial [Klebsiella pneumoniae]|uniref:hypothetical protein n=1 Tax=Klebsiella pneumoniae TaxID=573 RepID=UPI001F027175
LTCFSYHSILHLFPRKKKCLAVEEAVAVDLAASAAVAVEDAGCTPTWRAPPPLPSLRELHQ